MRSNYILTKNLNSHKSCSTEVRKLNREFRVIRKWSRRCDPASFGLNERGTFLVVVCHCFDGSLWEGS